MEKLEDWVAFQSGSPQFRIVETEDPEAPAYIFYSQAHLERDLTGLLFDGPEEKKIHTFDAVSLLEEGDVIFSLISGRAAMVQKAHTEYLLTQNYVRLKCKRGIEPRFLIYLLNEDKSIKRQWRSNLQGSIVIKYTLRDLQHILLPPLPVLSVQKKMGVIYHRQLKREALTIRAARLETKKIIDCLGRRCQDV